MDVLCTFETRIEPKFGTGVYQRPLTISKSRSRYQTPFRNLQHPASSKSPNPDSKDTDVLCTFKTKIESQNSAYRWTIDQWSYQNQYQDAKPQSGTSRVLQSPKSGLKGHGCSLHFQNQDREPKFRTWMFQGPVTIFKSWSRCLTPVRNLQHPQKPKMMTWRTWMIFAPSKSR